MSFPFTTGDLVSAADMNSIQAVQIATLDLSSTTTFSSIPQDFRDLQISLLARTSNAVTAEFVRIRFNGDTGANYFTHRWRLLDTVTSAVSTTGETSAGIAVVTGANAGADFFGSALVTISGYVETAYRQIARSDSSAMPSGTASTDWQRNIFQSGRNGTVAITSIDLVPGGGSFAAGSRATLYGVGVL